MDFNWSRDRPYKMQIAIEIIELFEFALHFVILNTEDWSQRHILQLKSKRKSIFFNHIGEPILRSQLFPKNWLLCWCPSTFSQWYSGYCTFRKLPEKKEPSVLFLALGQIVGCDYCSLKWDTWRREYLLQKEANPSGLLDFEKNEGGGERAIVSIFDY